MADEIIIDDNGGVGGSLRVTAISAELSKLKNLDATIFLSAGSLQYLVYKHGSAEPIFTTTVPAGVPSEFMVRAGLFNGVQGIRAADSSLSLRASKPMTQMGAANSYYMPPKLEVDNVTLVLEGLKVEFTGRVWLKVTY